MTLFVFVMAGIAVRRTASLPLAYSAFLWLHFRVRLLRQTRRCNRPHSPDAQPRPRHL